MRYLVPIGRVLLASIFVRSSPGHFRPQTAAYAAQKGVPAPSVAVPVSGALALLGGLSVAVGYQAKLGGALLTAFLVPVTAKMHNFWAIPDSQEAELQQTMFMKNLSMLGGALLITYFGAGPISIDEWLHARRAAEEEEEALG